MGVIGRTIAAGLVAVSGTLPRAAAADDFGNWLEGTIWPLAAADGVARATFDAAFAGVAPDWDLPGVVMPGTTPQTQRQAEFGAPARYFQPDRLAGTAAIGRRVAGEHREILDDVEQATGVPGRIVLAIWARESGYGRVAISHNAFQVLATHAFADVANDYLASELIGALAIAQAGHVPVSAMKSSWAGALGQPQMMPRSFLAYARDGDGDGHADIWRSDADTIASIANFLLVHGWVPGRDWGFEVEVPETVSCTLEGPDQGRPISAWEAMGIARVSGQAFPAHERDQEGYLLMPAGRYGPAFVVTPNFHVLKRYNRSDLYALYVGHLGDRIQYGVGGFQAAWRDFGTLFRSEITTIQKALEALGHDVGGADGLPGYKTRRSIGRWQEQRGEAATCFPATGMAEALGG